MTHPKVFLRRYGLAPKKSLGQNFLSDPNILNRITELASLEPEDSVLEIGPGTGNLTECLAGAAGRVVAIEIDQSLYPILIEATKGYPNVEIVIGDILEMQPSDWFNQSYKVVANIPYYITGAVLRHLLGAEPVPNSMILTVQSEIAERLVAQPGRMSLLAATVRYYGQVEKIFTIKAGAFWPPPKVESAVIRFRSHPERRINTDEELAFFRLLKVGFSQKRKQIFNNLKRLDVGKTRLEMALHEANIDRTRRAQTLNMEEWYALHKALSS